MTSIPDYEKNEDMLFEEDVQTELTANMPLAEGLVSCCHSFFADLFYEITLSLNGLYNNISKTIFARYVLIPINIFLFS